MTRKEKADIINTVRGYVIAELKDVNASELYIKNVETALDPNKMKVMTKRDIRFIAEVIRISKEEVKLLPVTKRTLEAVEKILHWGLWYCEKFGLNFRCMFI